MQSFAPSPTLPGIVQALLAGVELVATVHLISMPEDAVRMARRPGRHPVVYLDPSADDDHLRLGLLGVLRVLSGDSPAEVGARVMPPPRHLHSVS